MGGCFCWGMSLLVGVTLWGRVLASGNVSIGWRVPIKGWACSCWTDLRGGRVPVHGLSLSEAFFRGVLMGVSSSVGMSSQSLCPLQFWLLAHRMSLHSLTRPVFTKAAADRYWVTFRTNAPISHRKAGISAAARRPQLSLCSSRFSVHSASPGTMGGGLSWQQQLRLRGRWSGWGARDTPAWTPVPSSTWVH